MVEYKVLQFTYLNRVDYWKYSDLELAVHTSRTTVSKARSKIFQAMLATVRAIEASEEILKSKYR